MTTKHGARVLGALGLLVTGLSVSSVARTDELPAWLTERRIIGENNLESIEATRDTDFYTNSRVVARVETSDGMGFCTSSRVGNDLFLTNFHCFEFTPCESLQFHLGYERDLAEHDQLLFKCKEVLAKNETFDYALYRVEFAGPVGGTGDTHEFPFPGLASAIPDNDQAGISKTFAIVQDGSLTNLKVRIKIRHTYVGDLRIKLTSPAGTEAVLTSGSGGDQDDMDRTFTFNDGLRVFAGQVASGDWTLNVADVSADDKGTLDEVSFSVTTPSAEPTAGGAAPEDYPIATLWAGTIAVNQPLIVASHPAARLKEIDRSDNCKLRTIEPEDMEGRKTITHLCDTEGGSSGSPIIDRATGRIVALHWGGTNEYNLAIPMALVVQDIQSAVSSEVFGEMKVER